MGGAFSAVGGDYSASYWNPAALTQIRRTEISGGISHLVRENISNFNSQFFTTDELSKTRLSEIGFAYPVPTFRGSLVFSFGYNRTKNFDANFALDVFNGSPDDSIGQSWNERELGMLNSWTLAGAMELSPQLSAGLGINVWSGTNDYLFSEKENDIYDIWTFDTFRADDRIESDFTGFNVTMGMLYKVNSAFQLSASISTPTTYTILEKWSADTLTTYDDSDVESFRDDGRSEYKIQSPAKLTTGASLRIAGLILSGQFDFNNWSQIQYQSEPPFYGESQESANEEIIETYVNTVRTRLGAELSLPGTGTQLRAGIISEPSPYAGDTAKNPREYVTFGLGFLLDKQTKLDIALVHGKWKEENGGLNEFVTAVNEEIKVNKIFATLSFRY